MTTTDYIGMYGAVLSTIIALIGLIRYFKGRKIHVSYNVDPFTPDKTLLTFYTKNPDPYFVTYFYFERFDRKNRYLDGLDPLTGHQVLITVHKGLLGHYILNAPDHIPCCNKNEGEKVIIRIFYEGRHKYKSYKIR